MIAGRLDDGRCVHRIHDPYWLEVYTLDPDQPTRVLPDGREIVVMPWSCGGGQLSTTRGRTGLWDDTWNYTSFYDAVTAAWKWDGQREPDGWYRHPHTGRRRLDSDPTREIYQP